MRSRASWGNSFTWAAVVAIGLLGAAIAKGLNVTPPNTPSRSADPSPAHPHPLSSAQTDDISHPSQCTNFNYLGEAAPAELETEVVLQAPIPYAAPEFALTSNPSIPSPSSGFQVAPPYASSPLFSPSLSQPTTSPVTPAATAAPDAVQMSPPTSESPPLPSGTSVPAAMLSPTFGMLPTPVGSTAAEPAAVTASPAMPSSPATVSPSTTPVLDEPAVPSRPVTSPPVASPFTASPSLPPTLDASAASSSTPAAASSPGTSDSTSTNAPAPAFPSSPAAPIPASPSLNATSGAVSSPDANSNALPSQLQFAPIPFGFQPLVTAQATFQAIPASSLTLLQVAEVASDLQQALANIASGSVPVTAVVTPISVEAAAAAPMPGRRHLLQAGNTLQATVLFTAAFATAPGSNNDVQASVQAAVATAVAPLTVTTSATSIGSGSYNVTIVFPANNQVSSSASQGTLAATTFLAGLRSSPTTQLAGLAASAGSFTVASSQIQNELVNLPAGSTSPAAAASPARPSPLPLPTPDVPASSAVSTVTSPSLSADAPPVAEPTPNAASEFVPTSTADASAVPAAPTPSQATPSQATSSAGNVSPVLGTPPGASPPPPPLTPPPPSPPPDAVQPSPPSSTATPVTASPTREPTSEATAAPTREPPAGPVSTPNPAEAAPQATPLSPLLTMNVSVAFPPTATAAAQDLASMLYNQSQRDFYAVVDRNGPILFSNVVYGGQPIPISMSSLAPAPGPVPDTSAAALPAAAAPESAPSAAAIESYSGSEANDFSSAASGQLYAINMQYGVGGARTNAVANLLVFSFNSSRPPRATDFAVQLGDPAQIGDVSVLSTYSSPSDYLIRVDCPEGYTGPVTVDYASPMIQAVNYSVIDSALQVKVTASTGTQQ